VSCTIADGEGRRIVNDPRVSRLRHSKERILAWAATVAKLSCPYRLVMVGLTYRDGREWTADDIREVVRRYQEVLRERLITYMWVAELQRRGDPHYHLVLVVKPGTDVPKPDEAGLWLHGSSSRETWHNLSYLESYAGKLEQKGLGEWYYPLGCRIVGLSWRHLASCAPTSELIRKESMLPGWVKACCGPGELMGAEHVRGGWLVGSWLLQTRYSFVGLSRYQYKKVCR
jgi:hypothetical protein